MSAQHPKSVIQEWSVVCTDEGIAVLAFTIHTRERAIRSALRQLNFQERRLPPRNSEWVPMPPLDDREAWVGLHNPADAFMVLVDRTTGFVMSATDLDLTKNPDAGTEFVSAAGQGVQLRITFPGRAKMFVAKVVAILDPDHHVQRAQ